MWHVRAAGLAVLGSLAIAQTSMAAKPVVTNVVAQQQAWPSFVVDIHYDVFDANGHTQEISAAISTNSGGQYDITSTNLAGDIGAGIPIGTNKHIAWDAGVDLPEFSSDTVRVRIAADNLMPSNPPATGNYCVIDLSVGPSAEFYPLLNLSSQPVLTDGYQTTKILLRRIHAGSFVMGAPENELGRDTDDGPQHTVTLSSNFYMGVFEITQAQYAKVMGSNPAYFQQGAHGPKRPVEQVSWNTVRGGTWPGSPPGSGAPTNTSFMGVLRAKTGLPFDLPTEAQWEYACRAGTTNALNNNTNLTNVYSDGNMNILGRYWCNGGSSYSSDPINGAHTTVGAYQANNWGLYDMHGNVWEWCLDWYEGAYEGDATDPTGPATSDIRVYRSGSWAAAYQGSAAKYCRSADRGGVDPDFTNFGLGFRLGLTTGGGE